jgi:hypothetical protein
MDSAALAHEERHFRAGLAELRRSFGCIADLMGMLRKPAHGVLIG